MKYYETLYLINPNLSDEENHDIINRFNELIEKKGGVVIRVDEWGKKTLAYTVKKFDKGYYVLLQYCGDGTIVPQIERAMQLDERILKYQTIKLSDHENPEELKAKAEENGKADEQQSGDTEKATSGEESKSGNDQEG
ncbi:MAG: 30S ribosomal protein S6 [Deltaproteobacteria bacterium]|nr:MAG: 30S ribosomal protein S6 [Deltaproteobacteria bacterium]